MGWINNYIYMKSKLRINNEVKFIVWYFFSWFIIRIWGKCCMFLKEIKCIVVLILEILW